MFLRLGRGKCSRIQSVPNELALLTNNLPSGYHRDMQLTKEILFPAIEDLKASLTMVTLMLSNITVRDNILKGDQYKHLFTVEKINDLVNQGVSFRDAYKQVGAEVEAGNFSYSAALNHTHEGSIGNLCNEGIRKLMDDTASFFDQL